MTQTLKTLVGQVVTIAEGTRVTTRGQTAKKARTREVTIRKQELTKGGNVKVSWKCMGYRASAILKQEALA